MSVLPNLTKELKEAIAGGFKPEFGNQRHFSIIERLGFIEKDKKELARKEKASKIALGKSALRKRIENAERDVAKRIISERVVKTGDKTVD